MDSNKVLTIFSAMLNDSIARCAPVPAWEPADVTDTAVREAVTAIVKSAEPVSAEPPVVSAGPVSAGEMARCMERQLALEEELASGRF